MSEIYAGCACAAAELKNSVEALQERLKLRYLEDKAGRNK